MTTADQIVERDGHVNVGGEWLDLHPEPDLTDPDVIRAQADWRHRYQAYLNDDALNSHDANSQPENRPWPYRSF